MPTSPRDPSDRGTGSGRPDGWSDDGLYDEFDEIGPDTEIPEDAPPYWFPGQHLSGDARAMGLTHHVPDGALLDFAGSLDASKAMHRVTAWVLLVVFGLPVVFAIMRIVDAVW